MSATIDLGGIHVDLVLDGGADFGLDEIRLKELPIVKAEASIKELPIIKAEASIKEIPLIQTDSKVALGLDDIRLKELPVVRADVSIKEIPLIRTDSKVDLGLDNIRIQELPPIKLEFSFNPIRIHLPLNYSFCIELFGFRLFKFSLCGEGMVVTEDYQPRSTERCG